MMCGGKSAFTRSAVAASNDSVVGIANDSSGCAELTCHPFSIVAVIVEKQSRFLRFHAFQSLFFHGAAIVAMIGFQILGLMIGMISAVLALIFHMLLMLVGLVLLVAEILLMVKAYNGEEYELPTIGPKARKYV